MVRLWKHIQGCHIEQTRPAVEQEAKIPRERGRIAAYEQDCLLCEAERGLKRRERPFAGRIQDDDICATARRKELFRNDRDVARDELAPSEPLSLRRAPRGLHGLSLDLHEGPREAPAKQRKREVSGPSVQVEKCLGIGCPGPLEN